MREDDDIEALLAEVDRSLSSQSRPAPTARPAVEPARSGGSSRVPGREQEGGWRAALADRVRIAGTSAALAAAAVFALFAVTPFLGAVSGAAGAALATFVAVAVLARRR
ncbi:hypothetical protein [Motilibacter peucedani]|uniref:hypothetical protein n=1 Tax=Motilibacter peucedani TaxID=598650 RepID=UPI000EB00F7F|nr:hypothetical protein [Motilibacter peucedani]